MECPNGSICTEIAYNVITLRKAMEWFPDCKEYQLPIKVNSFKASNGRVLVKIYSNGKLIHSKG